MRAPTSLPASQIPKSVAAKSWVAYHHKSKEVIGSYNFQSRREIASLTKVMTAKCVIEICSLLHICL